MHAESCDPHWHNLNPRSDLWQYWVSFVAKTDAESGSVDDLMAVLDSGTCERKIKVLEDLSDTDRPQLVEAIIPMLDDPDIRVRGEAFSSLMGNSNRISDILIPHLSSSRTNIRAFVALVLANRKDLDGIAKITELTKDPSSMVRSCAEGSLEFLAAHGGTSRIQSPE